MKKTYGGVDVLGDNITTVHQAAGHVLAVTGIALHHHVRGLKYAVGDLFFFENQNILQVWQILQQQTSNVVFKFW